MLAVFLMRAKKQFTKVLFVILSFVFLFSFLSISVDSKCVAESDLVLKHEQPLNVSGSKASRFFKKIKKYFNPRSEKKTEERDVKVFLGGFPLGFTLECEGVLIVAIGRVETENGEIFPAKGKDIKEGDVLLSVNGEVVKSASHLHSLLNDKENDSCVEIVLKRGKSFIKETIFPALEVSSNMKRLGFWIRDNAAGVGTLTYVRADNNRFGALGHSVQDIDTGKVLPISGGDIYKCSIVGYNKGTRGNPGELRGLFLRTGKKIGSLDNNNENGVYGQMGEEFIGNLGSPVSVGFRDSVKTGKAKILCTIDGTIPKEYDIEIVKFSHQSKNDKKSMVLKVTDKELISKTGGIVQGMSGSPIIQNGKLVGAVTHVFVNDPTKGFGVFIDLMIDN